MEHLQSTKMKRCFCWTDENSSRRGVPSKRGNDSNQYDVTRISKYDLSLIKFLLTVSLPPYIPSPLISSSGFLFGHICCGNMKGMSTLPLLSCLISEAGTQRLTDTLTDGQADTFNLLSEKGQWNPASTSLWHQTGRHVSLHILWTHAGDRLPGSGSITGDRPIPPAIRITGEWIDNDPILASLVIPLVFLSV